MYKNKEFKYFSLIWLLILVFINILLLISFLGQLHPMLDSVAHFRRQMAFLVILATIPVLCTKYKLCGLAIVIFCLFCAVSTYQTQGLIPSKNSGPQHFKLIQINLRYDNHNIEKLINLLNKENPDFITYQEASSHWQKALSNFAQTNGFYSYRCKRRQSVMLGATGFLSRYPFVNTKLEEPCPYDAGIATTLVDIGEQKNIRLSSIHLFWPWPYRQNQQLSKMSFTKEPLQIIGGDFNATSWSYAVKFVENKTITRHVNGIATTWLSYKFPEFLMPIFGLPIDQILLSETFKLNKVEQLPSIGSDHLPIKVEFSL